MGRNEFGAERKRTLNRIETKKRNRKRKDKYFGCCLLDFLEELDVSDGDTRWRGDFLYFDLFI